MRKNQVFLFPVLLFPVFLHLCCAATQRELRLGATDEDFLSRVRYIITREEAKIFSELPPRARSGFIEEFWKRRDPIPETELNEYREVYFQRTAEANRLFKGAQPGWLQDRGRYYILFGPPDERVTNPMGGRPIDPFEDAREMTEGQRVAAGEKATESWIYYSLFSSYQEPRSIQLVFVDSDGTGNYRLATNINEVIPGGIDSLLNPDLKLIHEVHKEEAERVRLYLQRALFDFSWKMVKQKNRALGSNLLLHLVLPFKKIIFRPEGEKLRAKLTLLVQIMDAAQNILWQYDKEYDLDFEQNHIEQNKEGFWECEVPVMRWLEKGKYSVYIRLENSLGDQTIEKLLALKM